MRATPANKTDQMIRCGSVSLSALLLIVVLAAIATVLCYRALQRQFHSELRSVVQRELSELFPLVDVFVGRVARDDRGAIIVNDVRMAAHIDGKREPILSAEQIAIHGKLDVSHFVQQSASVDQVYLIGVQVIAWPFQEGGWSVARLKPRPNRNRKPPEIIVQRSTLKIRQSAEASSGEIVLHDLQANVQPTQSQMQPAPDGSHRMQHQFQAHISGRSSGLLDGLTIQATFDSALESIEMAGDAAGLQFSQRLLELLPKDVASRLTQLAGLECEASCSHFQVLYEAQRPTEFSCQGEILSGRLRDPRLPYPLERIRSSFYFKNSLLQIRQMSARSGGASLNFDADIMGLGLDSPMVIRADARNLELDQRLYESLPENLQRQWDRLQLTGRISGNVQLDFDGSVWRQTAAIECHQVSLRPWLFPYSFTGVEGKVDYENGKISSECLTGKAGGQLVEAKLHFHQVQSQWLGRLHCWSHGTVAIDEELISALTPAGQPTREVERFVRSLHPTGTVKLVNATFERTDVDSPVWHRVLDAHVYDGRLQYEKFPYPIYNIRGRIFNRDTQWSLESFEGRNDSARIQFTGQWHQVDEGKLPFQLQFVAHSVPLVEDLFQALPQPVRNVWVQLQPAGTVGRVITTIERPTPQSEVDTQVIISEQSEVGSQPGKSLRLYPHEFPFHLYDVNCHVIYQHGVVSIQHASAHNGATRLALRGTCRSRPDGLWHGDVQWLPTTRLMLDSQLIRALPKSLQDSMQKIDFHGPVSVLGSSQAIFGDVQSKPEFSWDCQFDIEDGQLAGGEYVNAVRGTIWSSGSSGKDHLRASGQLSIDALRVMKIPVTNLIGPFELVDHRLYFGSAVEKVRPEVLNAEPTEMKASALAGTLRISGYSALETGKVHMDASLENADLSTLLLELGIPQKQTQAVCNAYLKDFRGIPWNPQTFHGSGSIHLTDARLYELPFMMRLLNVASINPNNASAFQTADIDFSIDGDHIPLKIAADGEVMRVRGEGWTNLRRDVDLQLYTYVGRRFPMGQVVTPLLAESRFATFMMVEVTGTLDNPLMQRRPFPQIEATLQQIFPEVTEHHPIRDALENWSK